MGDKGSLLAMANKRHMAKLQCAVRVNEDPSPAPRELNPPTGWNSAYELKKWGSQPKLHRRRGNRQDITKL
jgi:hypothetical protein